MEELRTFHELHAAAVGGAAYAITKSPRVSATIGVAAYLYMQLIGHGLPFTKQTPIPQEPVVSHNRFNEVHRSIVMNLPFN